MNNTIIESINKLTKIKSDLNQILVENGMDGSDVFTDYPDQFRELFRVTNILTSGTLDEIPTTTTNTYAVVVDPVMTEYQNIVTINCATAEATIYYWIVTDSGKNNVGVTALSKGNTVVCTESCTVWCYAQYREERSNEISIHCTVEQVIVPEPPRITRDGTTVTIEKFGEEDTIWYTIDGDWYIYTEPLTVSRYNDIYAFTQNYRGRSDTIIDEAPEKPVAPEIPEISFYQNVVTITCATEDATLYYRTSTNKTWQEYVGPFEIFRTDTYEAKASKYSIDSAISNKQLCMYIAQPSTPSIYVSNNKVYITCDTTGSTIYYKIGSGDYMQYIGPINLSTTLTITAKSKYAWRYSDETEATVCEYVNPASLVPAVPTISCTYNVVTMSCATANATIKYSIYESGAPWTIYTSPFEISYTTIYEAYATKNGYDSDVCSPVTCTYIEPASLTPEEPTISCTDNVVTMSCDTINATIYYRTADESNWKIYTEPITITENTIFIARSFKNDTYSDQVTYSATYIETPVIIVPDAPQITCKWNLVTITCNTENATIYYSIDYGDSVIYNGPFLINSNATITAVAKLNDTYGESSSLTCTYVQPDAPTISNASNDIIITGQGNIYYKIDNGEYTLYEAPFKITSNCTVYAFIRASYADSTIVSLECTYDSTIRTTDWVTLNYYQYEFPIKQYTQLTSTSQIANCRKRIDGSDIIRFVNKGNNVYIQFDDYSFAVALIRPALYRITKNNYYRTYNINSATKVNGGFYFDQTPPLSFTTFRSNVTIQRYTAGSQYAGNPTGRAVVDFGIPKDTSKYEVTKTNISLVKKLQYSFSTYSQNLFGQALIRFAPAATWNSYTDFPFEMEYNSGNMNGLTFTDSDSNHSYCRRLFSGYEIEIVE